MRILILGGSGMLGHRLWVELSKGYTTWMTLRSSASVMPDLPGVDRHYICEHVEATNLDEVTRVFAAIQPDVVINCIGLIKQLPLSNDPLSSLKINALLPHQLALIASAAKMRMLHFSTDCVFSGKKVGAYTEEDQSDAEDLYGRSKFLGEISYLPQTLTLRTSIIGRELSTSYGLLEWFLSQRQKIQGYRRAIFSGFTTGALARIVRDEVLPNPQLTGLYHLSSEPISKYHLLGLCNEAYTCGIEIVPDDDMVCNRALDSSRFRATTGCEIPTWRAMIDEMRSDNIPYDAWRK